MAKYIGLHEKRTHGKIYNASIIIGRVVLFPIFLLIRVFRWVYHYE